MSKVSTQLILIIGNHTSMTKIKITYNQETHQIEQPSNYQQLKKLTEEHFQKLKQLKNNSKWWFFYLDSIQDQITLENQGDYQQILLNHQRSDIKQVFVCQEEYTEGAGSYMEETKKMRMNQSFNQNQINSLKTSSIQISKIEHQPEENNLISLSKRIREDQEVDEQEIVQIKNQALSTTNISKTLQINNFQQQQNKSKSVSSQSQQSFQSKNFTKIRKQSQPQNEYKQFKEAEKQNQNVSKQQFNQIRSQSQTLIRKLTTQLQQQKQQKIDLLKKLYLKEKQIEAQQRQLEELKEKITQQEGFSQKQWKKGQCAFCWKTEKVKSHYNVYPQLLQCQACHHNFKIELRTIP